MRNAAILRWTGRGRVEDLESSLKGILRAERLGASLRRVGGSFVLEGPEPVGAATLFQNMPGVSWGAVGRTSNTIRGLGIAAGSLAPAYVRSGDTFSVIAESAEVGVTPSDVAGVVTSAILEAVKGARVDESKPEVRFRAVFEGRRSVVGAQLWEGAGGIPTGKRRATCLVSGGMHSSVVAWHTLLSGFEVRLVHAKVCEESLREVARLYSELSYRVDPSKLSLEVREGGSVSDELRESAGKHAGPVYGGFHAGCGQVPGSLARHVEAPLFLLTEEEFVGAFSGLSLRGYDSREEWKPAGGGSGSSREFGNERADMHRVLDGLTPKRSR